MSAAVRTLSRLLLILCLGAVAVPLLPPHEIARATVGTTTNSVTAQGNGVTTAFSYSFKIPNASEAVVIYTNAAGTQTTLLATQYTITGVGSSAGGTVTYPLIGSPIASGTTLTIERIVPYVQTTSIANQGPTFAAIESGLDNTVYQTQQLATTVTRSLQIPATDTTGTNVTLPVASLRASQFVCFDVSGNTATCSGASSGTSISTAMTPVVQATTLPLARTAMGVPSSATTITAGTGLTGGGDLSANRALAVATNGVTNAQLAQMAANTIKGNSTGSTANAADIAFPIVTGGSWTPADASGSGLTFSGVSAQYTRIGNMIFAYGTVTYPATADATAAVIGGLPVTVANAQYARQGMLSYSSTSNASRALPNVNATTFGIFNASGGSTTNAQLSGTQLFFQLIYPAV